MKKVPFSKKLKNRSTIREGQCLSLPLTHPIAWDDPGVSVRRFLLSFPCSV